MKAKRLISLFLACFLTSCAHLPRIHFDLIDMNASEELKLDVNEGIKTA